LENLGLQFDYEFDTTWDSDAGNLSRATSIIKLIDNLNEYTVDQLLTKTQQSTKHNQNHIVSGKFFNQCEQKNNESIAQIFKLIR
jgi:uncharacterized protein with ATP-grasp and redox domains